MFKYIEPEVAGALGEGTKLDTSVHPPVVHHLDFQFEGWLGDCLLECFPCFVMTRPAKEAVQAESLTGVIFEAIEPTKSDLFEELYPDRPLPEIYWVKIEGQAGRDDFGLAVDFRLVISEKALAVLKPFRLEQALISDF